ncbi:hypothetical protein [Clostridium tyrobutyricum]|uniref:hypothetical protein n=1 Tax=Clostridium tyrobutyricum TaxID=1519 RepID=UPI00189F7EBC|nr:hypothetical protein [Clostridium tyrobutyricum]MBR9648695.1 hypothetical protein [Clostridium tyrobutyricum]
MNNEEKILNILESMQSQIDENTQILKALEHSSEEHKALLDQLNHRTASVEGKIETLTSKVDTISKDLNFVETATGKNIMDIAYLKSVK